MHSLRHFYASLLIREGCSVKVVQARLGHATAAETQIVDRGALGASSREGPLIIEEFDATIVVPPGQRLEVDEWNDDILTISEGDILTISEGGAR